MASWTSSRRSPSSNSSPRATTRSSSGSSNCAPAAATWSRGSPTASASLLANAGHRGRRPWPREAAVLDLAQAAGARASPSSNLPDVIAFRVVVANPAACYRALGVIHQRWQAVPGRFKDFISTPKRNGYRSLHTTIIHSSAVRIEIQIRTPEMDREAEFGLAAHWAYKEGGDSQQPGQGRLSMAEGPARRRRPGRVAGGGARTHAPRDVPGPGVRLHAEGRADPACPPAPARSTSPMPSIPSSATPASGRRSTGGS